MDFFSFQSIGLQVLYPFPDDFTNYLWTFHLFRKSQVYDIFVNFTTYIQTQFELSIKFFQCDHGGDFDNHLFHQFCNAWVSLFVSFVLKILLKMENPKEKYAP